MNLEMTDDEIAFLEEVRAFLKSNVTAEFREAQRTVTTLYVEPEITRAWLRILNDKGWAAPLWPKEFGGPGWTAMQRYIWECECAAEDAPALWPQGVRHVGPLLIKYGTEYQRGYFLPRILSGEDYWCQGYSEASAGSDLAALKTRAVLDGDSYVVNGSKMWTSDAHKADWMFALVRTSVEAKKQDGLSILLIPMNAKGLSIQPIRSISGHHELNHVFLDNVRVPIEHLVGQQGRGWEYAKYVLTFERGGAFFGARLRKLLCNTLACNESVAARHQARIAALEIDVDTIEMTELRLVVGLLPGEDPSVYSSILKLRISYIRQEIARLGVELAGKSAIRWGSPAEVVGNTMPDDCSPDWSPVERHLTYRGYTIFAGASEIQREIISKSLT